MCIIIIIIIIIIIARSLDDLQRLILSVWDTGIFKGKSALFNDLLN